MDFFIADTHFGHDKIRAKRGFVSVEEMDELLINNWNCRVSNQDHVYIAGDLMYRNTRPAVDYLSRLNGKKHLIIGNHDRAWMRTVNLSDWFEEVGFVIEGDRKGSFFTVCHYPMMDWYRRRHGAHLIYGHIHNNTTDPYFGFLETMPQAYNAGVDVNGFKPVTLQELIHNTARYRDRLGSFRNPY
jgi:calcineurin-like phosphoesterase family protein